MTDRLRHALLSACATCLMAVASQAQTPAPPDALSKALADLATERRTFQADLHRRGLSPEQRISEMERWRTDHFDDVIALLNARKQALLAQPSSGETRSANPVPPPDAGESEKELFSLIAEWRAAMQEMHSRPLSLEKRVQLFDAFHQANRGIDKEIQKLAAKASAERLAARLPAPERSAPALSPEMLALVQRQTLLRQEINARRQARSTLPPEQRIAASEQDQAFFRSELTALRDLQAQLRSTNPPAQLQPPNP
jgi:hypothetical protein